MNRKARIGGSIPPPATPSDATTCASSVSAGVSSGIINSSSAPKEEIATEGGHWYLPDGTPFYTIPKAKGKGERPVTLRDARKVGAVPSVTTITKILASEGLNRYFARQMFNATVLLAPMPNESEDAFFGRCCAASKEHSANAANRGHKLHGAIEQFLRGEAITDQSWYPHIAKITLSLAQYGIDIHDGAPEHSFAHPLGFGGKVDWHDKGDESLTVNGRFPLVLDFKTKDTIDRSKKWDYEEKAMQLASYREGLGIPNARCVNVYVGCDDLEVLIFEWPEQDVKCAWEKFQLLLRYWQLSKKYTPTFIASTDSAQLAA
jgi:hypothetical protein